MPGFNTHYLFGVRCYQEMAPSLVKDAILSHPKVYSFGQQGPDFFFFWPLNYTKKPAIGSAMHTSHSGVFFEAMTEYALDLEKEDDRAIALAYLAGFLGHYTLDCVCHPYVYSRTGYDPDLPEPKDYFGKHVSLETDAGTLFLKAHSGKEATAFCQSGPVRLTKKEYSVIARMLRYALLWGYGRRFSLLEVLCALRMLPFCLYLLHDPHHWKRTVFSFAEKKLLGCEMLSPQVPRDLNEDIYDVLNLEHKPWASPWEKEKIRYESFPDLLILAARCYEPVAKALNTAFELETQESMDVLYQIIGNRSYHNGLEMEER